MNIEEFKVGDIVEATAGDNVVRGLISLTSLSNLYLNAGGVFATLRWFRGEGWTLTLIKAAPAPLPTACDYYFDRNGELWYVTPFGKLEFADFSEDQGNRERITKDVQFHRDYGPFVSRTELLKNRLAVTA